MNDDTPIMTRVQMTPTLKSKLYAQCRANGHDYYVPAGSRRGAWTYTRLCKHDGCHAYMSIHNNLPDASYGHDLPCPVLEGAGLYGEKQTEYTR